MRMCKQLCLGLAILLLVAGCAPRQPLQTDEKADQARLLATGVSVSKISISHVLRGVQSASAGDAKSAMVQALKAGGEKIVATGLSDDIYAHLEAAMEQDLRRYLLESGRWSDGEGVELRVEITHLRIRRTAAQLLLSYVAGNDELGADVILLRGGEVFAFGSVSTKLQSGGMYGSLTLDKRLDYLAQQIARKLVRSRL